MEISDERLRLAYWYAHRRATLGRIFVPAAFVVGGFMVIMLIVAVILLTQLWGTVTTHGSRTITLHDSFASFVASRSPQAFGVSSVQFVPNTAGEEGNYIVAVTNTNTAWGAPVIAYSFFFGEEEVQGESFVAPGASTYIVAQSSRVGSASFVIRNISWERLREKDAGTTIDFPVESSTFTPRVPTGDSKLALARVTAVVQNATLDDYWEAPFAVLLLSSDDAILGFRLVTVKDFNAGDVATLEATWTGSYSNARTISVIPQINIYDASLKKEYIGAVGEPK